MIIGFHFRLHIKLEISQFLNRICFNGRAVFFSKLYTFQVRVCAQAQFGLDRFRLYVIVKIEIIQHGFDTIIARGFLFQSGQFIYIFQIRQLFIKHRLNICGRLRIIVKCCIQVKLTVSVRGHFFCFQQVLKLIQIEVAFL